MVINVRNIAAFFMSCYLIMTGEVKKAKKRAAKGEFILSVYFHDPGKKLFECCVRWFIKNGFQFISVDELNTVMRGDKPLPRSAVVFTADDGWKGNKANIAAVAGKYKIPVTIFASTQPIETGEAYWWSYIAKANDSGLIKESVSALKKVPNEERLKIVENVKSALTLKREALTVEELQEIAGISQVSIGSHTVTHPILTNCSDQIASFEITESKKILEQWLQKNVVDFAYPNGMYTEREIKILKDSGYKSAFSTVPGYITPDNKAELYSIPRFDVLETVSFAENICRMTGVWFNRNTI